MKTMRSYDTIRPTFTRVVWVGFVAGVVAAVVEMLPILLIQSLMLHVGPVRIFQSIAGGLMGVKAYSGGSTSAVLGGFLHILISVAAGLVFAGAASRLALLLQRPVISGGAYGVVVFLVMSYIVVPLSAVAFKPATNPFLIAMSLTIHVVAFALPISLICKRLFGGPAQNSTGNAEQLGKLDFGH